MATPQAEANIAERVRAALESGDLDAIGELLAPDVRWGPPDDPDVGCANRAQVLDFWRLARDAGARAAVTQVVHGEGKLLVGLRVTGLAATAERGTETERWQVLTLANGLVTDIRGFDDRDAAAARAGLTS
jgi:ketosteroid isomerase-like protein